MPVAGSVHLSEFDFWSRFGAQGCPDGLIAFRMLVPAHSCFDVQRRATTAMAAQEPLEASQNSHAQSSCYMADLSLVWLIPYYSCSIKGHISQFRPAIGRGSCKASKD